MNPKKHGFKPRGVRIPEYSAWRAAKDRCSNPNYRGYANYGGRGIKVCDEWRDDFAAFLDHVGRRPSPKHSLDRIDNNRDYEPGNVRWATKAEQSRNQRRVKLDDTDVEWIRYWLSEGYMVKDVAAAFGVHHSHVSRIKGGQKWAA